MPRGERDHPRRSTDDKLGARRLAWRGERERSEREPRGDGSRRNAFGRERSERPEPRPNRKRQSLGRGRAAGAREKRGRLRAAGEKARKQGGKREPPPATEERPKDTPIHIFRPADGCPSMGHTGSL